jgi:hypothetical protein
MSREEKIEADIAKAERKQEEALKASDRALALEIEKRILVLQEELNNERQRQHHQLVAATQGKGWNLSY